MARSIVRAASSTGAAARLTDSSADMQITGGEAEVEALQGRPEAAGAGHAVDVARRDKRIQQMERGRVV